MSAVKYRRYLAPLKFCLVSGGMLAVKIGVTRLSYGLLSGYGAYLLAHVIVFLLSYMAHLKLTFSQDHHWSKLVGFLKSVMLLKAIDYAIFALLWSGKKELTLSVLVASGAVAFLRWKQFDRVFNRVVPAKAVRSPE